MMLRHHIVVMAVHSGFGQHNGAGDSGFGQHNGAGDSGSGQRGTGDSGFGQHNGAGDSGFGQHNGAGDSGSGQRGTGDSGFGQHNGAGDSGFGQHNGAGHSAKCPLLFDIDSDPEDDRAHQLEQQATQPTVMLPAVCPQSSPDKCLLVMGPDSPSGNHGVAQHAQQPDHSWQQRTETHAPSGPVSDLSPETCELLMDLDSEPEEHESAQLEQQHRHTTWQQPRNSEPSLGPASCHAESSATHSLRDMDMDPYVARFSDPEEDHQLQQQQQKQQQHWQLQHDRSQQQHEHQQQQVQASVAGSCIPIVFDDYEEEPDFVPDPGVFSPDLKQNQPQHAQHAQRDVQSDGHDQPQQWDAEEEQWQLQHPGSNITAATPAAAAADATHGKHSQTPPTTLLHTANAEPMQMAKSTAASLQYDQYRSQQIREAAESRPQTNSCPFVFGFEQEKEVGSQAMAESSADKEEEAWQLQESGSGKQLHQQLPVAMQGISHRLHAQLQAAQDQCPLVFDIESDEEDGHRSSMGTQPDHAGLDQGAIVSTAGRTGNSHPSADSAGQLSNSPRGDAPPELFRQSPYDPAVSGQFRQSPHNPAVSGQVRQSPHDPAVSGQFWQSLHDTAVSEQFRPSSYDPAVSGHFRQSPPAWDSVPDVHRSTVQMQTGNFHAEAQCLVAFCHISLATGRSMASPTLVLHV